MKTLQIVLVLVVAGSLVFLFLSHFNNLLGPNSRTHQVDRIIQIIAIVEIIILISGFVIPLYSNKSSASFWLVSLIIVSIILSSVPRIADSFLLNREFQKYQKNNTIFETNFLERKSHFQNKVLRKESFNSEEALDLIFFCRESDLSYRSLPDYSNQCLTIIQEAFTAKLIDPNGKIYGEKYHKLSGQTLYSYIYNVRAPYTNDTRESEIRYLKTILSFFVKEGALVNEKDLHGATLRDYIETLESFVKNS